MKKLAKISNWMKKKIDTRVGIALLISLFVFIFGFIIFEYISFPFPAITKIQQIFSPAPPPKIPAPPLEIKDIKKFSSEEDFKSYLAKADELRYMGNGMMRGKVRFEMSPAPAPSLAPAPAPEVEIERVSETTVQVIGIDEPDIVKTDGKEIYFSSERSYYDYVRIFEEQEQIIPDEIIKNETKIIKAFPPVDLEVLAKIKETGDLLLKNNILVIFSNDQINGYDVSNSKSPEKKWTIALTDNNTVVVSARLYQDKIYLVTRTIIDTNRPCPIKPLSLVSWLNGKPADKAIRTEIRCTDIYHPTILTSVDVTYTAAVLNLNSGEVEKTVSFIGSSNNSIVYMSEKGIYITYSYNENIIKFFSGFFKENQDVFPSWLNKKLEKVEEYDISQQSKLVEFQFLFEKYFNSLNNDERMKIENEINNRMSNYYKKHGRELETTGIIKIGLDNFEIKSQGNVPGYPLNQFALDEYQDNLRIATTIGERMQGFISFIPWINRQESANDIYILDKDLKIQGSIKDLGLTERIYSVRFIEDKGYLVTFRQIDPFYVLDLSNPQKPELKGELKIPGYSSYLHPITKDKILGIGKEEPNVKISLFDIESPEKPTEIDKYILDEYWSDILNTHHAFLLDKKHNIFFLPGGRGGYIFSYKDDKLNLIKVVSGIQAKRAIYINDFLYIIGDDKIVVLNEINWEKVNEIKF